MVVIGAALITALNGLGGGFNFFINEQFRSLAPDVLTITPSQTLPQAGPPMPQVSPKAPLNIFTVNAIRPILGVKEVIPSYRSSITLISGGKSISTAVVGIDPSKLPFVIPSIVFEDGGAADRDPTAMILGYNIAHPAGESQQFAQVGSVVRAEASTVQQIGNTQKLVIERRSFVVRGVIKETGNLLYDNSVSIPLQSANSLLKKSGEFDQIFVVTENTDMNASVERGIRAIYGNNIGVTTPRAVQETLQSFISGFSIFLFSIGVVSMLVGSVGIVTTLFTSVTERTKELGILKAMGATSWIIVLLILAESMIIGVLGGTLGVLSGVLMGELLTQTAQFGVQNLRPIFTLQDLMSTWFLAVVLSVIAGTYPAWRASRLTAVAALRKE
jgi:putative ABC transport system permease protein